MQSMTPSSKIHDYICFCPLQKCSHFHPLSVSHSCVFHPPFYFALFRHPCTVNKAILLPTVSLSLSLLPSLCLTLVFFPPPSFSLSPLTYIQRKKKFSRLHSLSLSLSLSLPPI